MYVYAFVKYINFTFTIPNKMKQKYYTYTFQNDFYSYGNRYEKSICMHNIYLNDTNLKEFKSNL